MGKINTKYNFTRQDGSLRGKMGPYKATRGGDEARKVFDRMELE